MECSGFAAYVETVIMYAMDCTCPVEIRLFLSNFVVRTGKVFLTIWFAEVAGLTGGQ